MQLCFLEFCLFGPCDPAFRDPDPGPVVEIHNPKAPHNLGGLHLVLNADFQTVKNKETNVYFLCKHFLLREGQLRYLSTFC